jgi:hypothetical protein
MKMKKSTLFAALLLTPVVALAADADNGKELYDETYFEREINGEMRDDVTCASCHEPAFYTRPDRLATSYKNLEQAWVQGCNDMMNVGWFPEEVADVTAYLNKTYYKFPQE